MTDAGVDGEEPDAVYFVAGEPEDEAWALRFEDPRKRDRGGCIGDVLFVSVICTSPHFGFRITVEISASSLIGLANYLEGKSAEPWVAIGWLDGAFKLIVQRTGDWFNFYGSMGWPYFLPNWTQEWDQSFEMAGLPVIGALQFGLKAAVNDVHTVRNARLLRQWVEAPGEDDHARAT